MQNLKQKTVQSSLHAHCQVLNSLHTNDLGVGIVRICGNLLSARHGAERLSNAWHGGALTMEQVRHCGLVKAGNVRLSFFVSAHKLLVSGLRSHTGAGKGACCFIWCAFLDGVIISRIGSYC